MLSQEIRKYDFAHQDFAQIGLALIKSTLKTAIAKNVFVWKFEKVSFVFSRSDYSKKMLKTAHIVSIEHLIIYMGPYLL